MYLLIDIFQSCVISYLLGNYSYLVASKDRPIENASVACVLAYSIIMLHTDQHNPQVRVSYVLLLT